MTDQHPAAADLHELSDHTRKLAAELAGPLHRVTVRSGDASVEVEWQPQPESAGPPATPASPPTAAAPDQAPPAPGSGAPMEDPADEGDHILVSSPMVGTFYRAPSPDAAPFVEIGDTVTPGQTVAMVEAMKLFNPITAEHPGIVAAVLAENGQAVEFGQALLRLAADDPTADGPATDDPTADNLSDVAMSGKE